MSGEQKKVRADMVNEDRISYLPMGVINLILSYLPTRDVIRTSILSTGWRYRWATIPSLKFGEECSSTFCGGSNGPLHFRIDEKWSKTLAHIVDNVLILHSGSIQLFKVKDICAIPDIDRWIVHVSRRSIRELVLKIEGVQLYKLPSSLYTCESLVKLKLSNCVMRVPPSFKGFRSLKHLSLINVTLTGDAFENLISSCPLLRKLKLVGIRGHTNLKIDALNLHHIDIEGVFENITFGNGLEKVSVIFVDLQDDRMVKERGESLLIQIFNSFPGVQHFEARNYFLTYLASGNIPDSLPTPCLALCHLAFCIHFNDLDECLAVLCLIRSAPNLKVLEVWSFVAKNGDDKDELGVWMDNTESHLSLNRLQVLIAENVVGYRRELEFIKFVLLNSPVLEKTTVRTNDDYGSDPELPVKLLRLRRASPQAEVIFNPP